LPRPSISHPVGTALLHKNLEILLFTSISTTCDLSQVFILCCQTRSRIWTLVVAISQVFNEALLPSIYPHPTCVAPQHRAPYKPDRSSLQVSTCMCLPQMTCSGVLISSNTPWIPAIICYEQCDNAQKKSCLRKTVISASARPDHTSYSDP
jgi:hypothetical protein